MTDDTPLLDDRDRELLEAQAVAPAPGFADRVLAARRQDPSIRAEGRSESPRGRADSAARRRRWAIALGVAAAAIAIAYLAIPSRSRPPATGEVAAAGRTTASVGARATAVLEPGAAVSWRVAGDGAARVVQPRGAVFYRVEPGAAFVVETPAGDISVEGTCFAVAVSAHATAVTVYEGRVLVSGAQGSTRLAAGERAVARPGAPPGAATAVEPMVWADPTRELAALRSRIRELEAEAAAAPAEPDDDPAALAAECRIRWDLPIPDKRGDFLGPAQATVLGLSEADRTRLDAALRARQTRALDELRRLYTEVTGDAPGALSWEALQGEIDHKSSKRDVQEAFRRISAERAGLAAPPADLARLPAVERMYRHLISIGDEAERDLAAVIGPTRARTLRAVEGGWGSRHSASRGCPD